jgi:flagellar hook-length control protein FliK
MNASLLALASANSTASGTSAPVSPSNPSSAQAGEEGSSPFAELLDLANEQQWQLVTGGESGESCETETLPEASENAEPETEMAAAETVLAPTLLAVAVSEALLPDLQSSPVMVEDKPDPTITDTDPLLLSDAAEAAVFSLASVATEDRDSGESLAVAIDDLPRAGKSLPLWSLVRAPTEQPASQQPAANAPISELLSADDLPQGWQALLDNVGKLGHRVSSELSTPPARSSVEPLLSLSTASWVEPTNVASRDSDVVPGIAVRSPHFATLLGNQVLWQAKVGNNQAEIRLDPPDLGPIEVRISQSDNETHLHFVVGHAGTRDQLEQALPRLRELFGQGGLQLGQVEVEQGRRDNPSGQPSSHSSNGGKRSEEPAANDIASHTTLVGNGLIDDYA